MPILQSMEGKLYDIPDDQAHSFEVPREKVKELLEKAGLKAQGGGETAPAPSHAAGPSNGHAQGAPTGAPPGAPVVIQVFAAQPSAGGAGGSAPPAQQAQAPQQQGADGEVNPYWWYRYYYVVRPWGNYYWNNW